MNGHTMKQLALLLIAGICGASCGHSKAKTPTPTVAAPLPRGQGDQLPGQWRLPRNNFASIVINKDSVFYTDQNRGAAYKCAGPAIILTYGPHADTMNYYVRDSDTLAMYTYRDSTVYVKMD